MVLFAFWVGLVTLMLFWGTWPAWLLLAVLPALGLLSLRAAGVGPMLITVLTAFACVSLIDRTLIDRAAVIATAVAWAALLLLAAADTISTADSAVPNEEPQAPPPSPRYYDDIDEGLDA